MVTGTILLLVRMILLKRSTLQQELLILTGLLMADHKMARYLPSRPEQELHSNYHCVTVGTVRKWCVLMLVLRTWLTGILDLSGEMQINITMVTVQNMYIIVAQFFTEGGVIAVVQWLCISIWYCVEKRQLNDVYVDNCMLSFVKRLATSDNLLVVFLVFFF